MILFFGGTSIQTNYPKLLFSVARKLLCIPATSTPVAGLTIANDRAGLTMIAIPNNASNLVFLKGVDKLRKDFQHNNVVASSH